MKHVKIIGGRPFNGNKPLDLIGLRDHCGFRSGGGVTYIDDLAPVFKDGQVVVPDGLYLSADPKWPVLLSPAALESRLKIAEDNPGDAGWARFKHQWESAILKVLT